MAGVGRYTKNKHLADLEPDILFHLKLSTDKVDMKKEFGNIKFVCVGGSPVRMVKNAHYLKEELAEFLSEEEKKSELINLTGEVDRYVLYKVGPVLVANHGIGVPSMSILVHEVFKLLCHAEASDVQIVRLGTSGGLGVEPGTVIVASEAVNPEGRPVLEQYVCGRKSEKIGKLDEGLSTKLLNCTEAEDNFKIISGKTMSADDFYEAVIVCDISTAQGRLDGAICHFTLEDKMAFLKRLHDQGVRNIEMEALGFSALTSEVGMTSAVMCVTLVNRLIDDQVKCSREELRAIEHRPIRVFARHVKKVLSSQCSEKQ